MNIGAYSQEIDFAAVMVAILVVVAIVVLFKDSRKRSRYRDEDL